MFPNTQCIERSYYLLPRLAINKVLDIIIKITRQNKHRACAFKIWHFVSELLIVQWFGRVDGTGTDDPWSDNKD